MVQNKISDWAEPIFDLGLWSENIEFRKIQIYISFKF